MSDSLQYLLNFAPSLTVQNKVNEQANLIKEGKIPAGAYKGKEFSVLKTDIYYSKWILGQVDSIWDEVKKYINDNVDLDKGLSHDTKFMSGKHRGHAFAHVIQIDKAYVESIMRMKSRKGQAKDFADYISKVAQQLYEATSVNSTA
jgi:hypothetical protein